MYSKPMQTSFVCPTCKKVFGRKSTLNRHMLKHVDFNFHHCEDCGESFTRYDSLLRHRRSRHQLGGKRPREEDPMPAPKKLKETPKEFYDLNKIREWRSAKFNTTNTTYKATVKDLEIREIKEILVTLKTLFTSIMDDVTRNADDNDLIRMAVQSPELDFPIQLPFTKKSQLTVDHFLGEIERVLQSFEQFILDGSFEIDILHAKVPIGSGGGTSIADIDLETFLQGKKCILRIKNNDDLCCARAIITAKAKLDEHPLYNSIRLGKFAQKDLARELHSKASVPMGTCGIDEIKHFQAFLPGYQIYVISRDHFNCVIYSGPEAEKKIYLYHYKNHYDVITSMPAFFNRSYYCHICQKGYDHKESHKCNNTCIRCRKIHKECVGQLIHCKECNFSFQGEECFNLHKSLTKGGNSTCNTYYCCDKCGDTVNRKKQKREHVCGEVRCKTCDDFFPPGHQCYMKPLKDDDEGEINTFIFFDFECTQDDLIQCDKGYKPDDTKLCTHCHKTSCGSFIHKPNLCVAQKVCSVCAKGEINDKSTCEKCGPNEIVFSGEDTTEKFCKWLFSKKNKGATVLCHNFKGYDSYPIMKYLFDNGVLPTIIPCGSKNMSLEIPACKIRMIDSINFMPTALKNLPKMFGLSELAKGYFPHLYNTKKNQKVVLSHLPDAKFYNPDGMKSEERAQFLKWYDLNKHNGFDFQEEILKYCRSDVDILRRACLELRSLFMNMHGGIDPFYKCITIASACMRFFRKNFLEEDTIGLIPAQGYCPEEQHSTKSIQWLKYLEHSEGIKIQHARNGGEHKVGPYKLDGFFKTEEGTPVALEFMGDIFHGCPRCYARETVNPVNMKTMGELHQATLEKQRFLEENGYQYISKWECDWDKEVKENPKLKEFIASLDLVAPLNPREAFAGGRTEAFTLYKESADKEEIDYVDFTSLYPYINKYGKYPIGHPTRIFDDFENVENYEGLIMCKVLPPRELFIPLLHCNINGKLMFPLCYKCAEASQQEPCSHDQEERSFTHTFTTMEVQKALELGYEIVKIYEVWHYDEVAQYDRNTKTGGLFSGYIDTFLKLKQESSGWPSWCLKEENKQCYISSYDEHEGIRLEYGDIEKNPGRRSQSKLMLNSFWGKLGQRSNLTQLEYVKNPTQYFDLLTSDRQIVTDVNFVNEDMVEMRWNYKDEFVESSTRTNVVLAAYTTAQARLKLYSCLENLGPRAIYCDTDSIIYTTKPGEEKLPLGDFLGELTDEVPHGKIVKFVTIGPKSYAYIVETPDGFETVTKMKGITLNYKNALNINFNTVKELIDEPSKKVVASSTRIGRNSKTKHILTTQETKECKLVFDKRVIGDNYVTYPYGY